MEHKNIACQQQGNKFLMTQQDKYKGSLIVRIIDYEYENLPIYPRTMSFLIKGSHYP